MSIIRIKVKDNIPDSLAVKLVWSVISKGLVSNNNTQYCYVTRFEPVAENCKVVTVYCDKGKTGSHLFEVYYD